MVRQAGDARTDFLYDGRSFLTMSLANSFKGVFADDFETGDIRCWTASVGGDPGPGPVKCDPMPLTRPIYSSQGQLVTVSKDLGQPTELTKFYLYLAGRPVAQLDIDSSGANTCTWLTVDHLGTPVAATDSTGTVVWTGGFEPFGSDFSSASSSGIDLRFPGQWMDTSWLNANQGNEQYFNVHRWYQHLAGKYGRKDPFLQREGLTNTYAYVDGNPLIEIDPFGLFGLADLPNIPPGVGDFSAGFGDALLFGFGDELRSVFGIGGVNQCSGWYKGGDYASLFVGSGRLAYAGSAKAITLVRYSRNLTRGQGARRAVSARNSLKKIFRGGLFSNYRNHPFTKIAEKYGNDFDEIIRAAGRTDSVLNIGGAWLAFGSLANSPDCTCP